LDHARRRRSLRRLVVVRREASQRVKALARGLTLLLVGRSLADHSPTLCVTRG
jgi:hypothetical protein